MINQNLILLNKGVITNNRIKFSRKLFKSELSIIIDEFGILFHSGDPFKPLYKYCTNNCFQYNNIDKIYLKNIFDFKKIEN